jgi:hypothetical protein
VPLGPDHGYQHIWKEAEAAMDDGFRFTWLDGNRYYSLITASVDDDRVFFGRIGAHDPHFNLMSEPMIILRAAGSDHLFASVIEPHGYFSEAAEKSADARSSIESVEILGFNEEASVVQITGKNDWKWRIMVNNGHASDSKMNKIELDGKILEWTGNFHVDLQAN